jgi:hypothetical protein
MLGIPLLLFALSGALAIHFHPLDSKPGLIDNGTFGPEVEVVHLFHGDAPIGVTISKTGRAFVSFNRLFSSL